jgi:hypothetical protein
MLHPSSDVGFEEFRRQRKRAQARQATGSGSESLVLQELERVEAQETQDRQLTLEVHDFFAAATKKAASIVERVAKAAEQEAGSRLQTEVEGFLRDALERMNRFIVAMMQVRPNAGGETHVEPTMRNLVGQVLDGFRWSGAQTSAESHMGQDPFATDLDEVQREFRQFVERAAQQVGDVVPCIGGEAQPTDESQTVEPPTDEAMTDDSTAHAVAPVTAAAEPRARTGAPARAAAAPVAADDEVSRQLEGYKSALKALVRQGVMQPDEARAAWLQRRRRLGL